MSRRLALLSLIPLIGCSRSQPAPEPPAPVIGIGRTETQSDVPIHRPADALPEDKPTLAALEFVTPYFEESPSSVWFNFEDTAKALNGEELKADPRDVMLGCFEVMRRLKVEPNGHQKIREFCSEYRRAREGAALDGKIRPTSHQEAVDLMVAREGFSTR